MFNKSTSMLNKKLNSPVFSLILLVITAPISYITSTFIVEVISFANAMNSKKRMMSLFPESAYATPDILQKFNKKDLGVKTSPYYIRQKIEIGRLFETFCA